MNTRQSSVARKGVASLLVAITAHALASPTPTVAEAAQPMDPGALAAWDLAARFDFNAAGDALRDSSQPDVSAETHDLAAAASLLGDQPRSADKVRRALAQFRALTARESLDPGLRATALYFEARILDLHLEPRDAAGARERYDRLLRLYPEHALAEQAALPLVLSLLHDASDATREQRMTAAEAVRARVTLPASKRDLDYVLGLTRLRWDLRTDLARAQLLAAAEIGFAQAQRQASLWFTLARLGDESHDTALARRSYGEFLRLALRDTRASLARARLIELEATTASVAPAFAIATRP